MFFGPDVFCEPDEPEGTLGDEFDLMNLSVVNVIFLWSGGVILLGIGYILNLLFDGVLDFSEHGLKVREHFVYITWDFLLFKFKVLLFNLID